MKNIYPINRILTILGIGISLTFWGAMIALPILGLAQLFMSLTIYRHRISLNKKIRQLFYAYVVTTLCLAGIFRLLAEVKGVEVLLLMFVWMFVSAGLAFFHLYITHRVNIETFSILN